jgi:hypothetical protein
MQDYFRDLTPDDFQLLKPTTMELEKDDALTVPFLGRENGAELRPRRIKNGESSQVILWIIARLDLLAMLTFPHNYIAFDHSGHGPKRTCQKPNSAQRSAY